MTKPGETQRTEGAKRQVASKVALEDKFAESFKAIRGKVDPDLKLGF